MNKENVNTKIDRSINKNKSQSRRKTKKKKKKNKKVKQIKQKPVSFLAKYVHRMEKIGKDGIYGIVKHPNIQINIPKLIKSDDSDSDDSDESEANEENLAVLPPIRRDLSVKVVKTLKERFMERQQKRILYRPYSLKDYKQLPDENNIKLGKLEPDLDNEDYRRKKQKRNEVIEYSKNLITKGIGLTMKKMPIPSLANKVKIKSENELKPLYLGKLYGKEMNSNSMIRNQERKRLLKILIAQSSNSQDSKIMKSGLSLEKEQYMMRLQQFKETLLPKIKKTKTNE